MSEYKEEQKKLDPSEVYDYEGETIDVGEPKRQGKEATDRNEYQQENYGSSFKVYQSNGSCLGILVVLLVMILLLVFFLPIGLFMLAVAIVIGLIKKIFG